MDPTVLASQPLTQPSQSAASSPKKPVGFSHRLFMGRITRKSYLIGWLSMMVLLTLSFSLLFFTTFNMSIETITSSSINMFDGSLTSMLMLLQLIVFAIVALYTISLTIRRLHDTGQSGFLGIILLIPVAGFILGLYLLFYAGTKGENKFGPEPKEQSFQQIFALA